MRARFLVLFFVFLVNAVSASIVTTLPGYDDGHGGSNLPFTLETGYVGLDNGNTQLFYYFVESKLNPATDPILFYVSGGPGCSGLWPFFTGIGPLYPDLTYNLSDTTKLPKLLDNPYSWSEFMNILFVDGPAGAGFSYSTTTDGYYTNNFGYGEHLSEFIHEWARTHRQRFKGNEVYISGDGFSGNPIPIAVDYINKTNQLIGNTHVNISGYVLIGPSTDFDLDFNLRYAFANRVGFIPDDIWKVAEESCNGNYINPESDVCELIMDEVKELVGNINYLHILDPNCGGGTGGGNDAPDATKCRKATQLIVNAWVDHEEVKEALKVDMDKAPIKFQACNRKVDDDWYSKDDIKNLVPYHKNFTHTNLRGLIISGDHDMDVSRLSLENWIWSLDMNVVEKWRPWYIYNETVGYIRGFQNDNFTLTYASIKGGGHVTPHYKPEECFRLVRRWLSGSPI